MDNNNNNDQNDNNTFDDLKDDLKDGLNNVKDTTSEYDAADINDNKAMGGLSYLGFLWLIPFFSKKDSPYVQFHLNQGLVTILAVVVMGIVSWILGLIPFIGWILSGIIGLVMLVLIINGAVNGFTGKVKEQPFIGGIKLLTF